MGDSSADFRDWIFRAVVADAAPSFGGGDESTSAECGKPAAGIVGGAGLFEVGERVSWMGLGIDPDGL